MHANVYFVLIVMLCNIAECFDEYVVDTAYGEETWTVLGLEEIVHLHPGQNTFHLSYTAIWKNASNDTLENLDILLTDSYFVFKKIRFSPKVDPGSNGNAEHSGEYFLSQSELQNRSCVSGETNGKQYTTCSVFGADIHASCHVMHNRVGSIEIQCALKGFGANKLHNVHGVFLLVSLSRRHMHDKESDTLHFWKQYTIRTVFDYSIPLKIDSHSRKIPATIIASVGLIVLHNPVDDSAGTILHGVSLRSVCFKNGMPTIMSRNPITYNIEKRISGNKRYLQVTVYFQLPRIEPGVYYCMWRVVNGGGNTMVRFRTNNMTCCSNDGVDKYSDYIATLRPWGGNTINIHDRYTDSNNAINEKVDIKLSKAQAAEERHTNAINACAYTIVAFLLVFFVAASCYMYRNIRRHIDECRREKMKLLEVLTKIDSRPKSYIFYDIFISYSSQDSAFIDTMILPGLETRGYTCCYDKRDFRLGTPVIQNICEGIYDSHKTLAILSKAYMASNWCLEMEFALTFRRIVSDDGLTDGLVMLQYKPCKVDPVLKNKNYLDWSDYGSQRLDEFWAKFTAVLGPPQVTEKKQQ